jgi:perosamine synthetase
MMPAGNVKLIGEVSMATETKLAPVRTAPFPGINDPAGRTLGDEELALLTEVIRSAKLNRGAGSKVAELERTFAARYGRRFCTTSTSGTAAIHVALGALTLEPGDEVITAPITDMGTVIPILLQNCVPVFADVDPTTLCLDPADVERRITPRTRVIIAVHLVGNACDMDAIMAIARRHNLTVIEDCAQAFLTEYKGRLVGTIGDIGCFSLQQSKHITCGDGGLTITDDERLGERLALFANKGWPNYGKGGRDYVMFGVNYRMTELQAAVVLAQLPKLDGVVARRIAAADAITAAIAGIPGLLPPQSPPGGRHSYWFYPLLTQPEQLGWSTADFARRLRELGIPAGHGYTGKPIFLYDLLRNQQVYGHSHYPWDAPGREGLPPVRYEPGVCPQTEDALARLVVIPCNEGFTAQDAQDIGKAIRLAASR